MKTMATKPRRKPINKICLMDAAMVSRHDELLTRLSEVTLGNGHPEDGLLFIFRKFMSEHKTIVDNIEEIKSDVKQLHKRADENKQAAATAHHAVEDYKKEVALIERTKGKAVKTDIEKRAEQRDKFRTIITGITAFLMVCGIGVTIYFSSRSNSQSTANYKELKEVKESQDTMKNDIKHTYRGLVEVSTEKPFDVKKHAAIADSIIKSRIK